MTASKLLNIMCDKLNNAIGPEGRMIEHIRSKKIIEDSLKGICICIRLNDLLSNVFTISF